ncbi:hypothetical protein ES707_01947 [subsurface metagenome]
MPKGNNLKVIKRINFGYLAIFIGAFIYISALITAIAYYDNLLIASVAAGIMLVGFIIGIWGVYTGLL